MKVNGLLFFAVLGLCLCSCAATDDGICFHVDASDVMEGTLVNPVDNLSYWDINGREFVNPARNPKYDVFEFTRYIQFMQCTGGNQSRDLLKDPENTAVLDDYDLDILIQSCHGVLSLGAKPLLKLGSVPLKYSDRPFISEFGTNVRPPRDWEEYKAYLSGIVKALVDEFGEEEVRSWRWGVMTEAENELWFLSENPDDTVEDFCRLYDTSVAAVQSVLGEDIYIGLHSLGQKPGCWDLEKFVKHVAEKGTRLCYLSASFYDEAPGIFEPVGLDMPSLGARLKGFLSKYGLDDVVIGIDEGGLLNGTVSGGSTREVVFSRCCGQTWQAGYDARLLKQMLDSGVSYFSHWNYLSQGIVRGYPSLSYYMAENASHLEGMKRLNVDGLAPGDAVQNPDIEAIAAKDDSKVLLMAYNFFNDLAYRDSVKVAFDLKLPEFAGRTVNVQLKVLDDGCNYFDEFWADRKANGWSDEYFHCTPDEHQIRFRDPEIQAEYMRDYAPKYEECAQLIPVNFSIKVRRNGSLRLEQMLGPNAVCWFEISAE